MKQNGEDGRGKAAGNQAGDPCSYVRSRDPQADFYQAGLGIGWGRAGWDSAARTAGGCQSHRPPAETGPVRPPARVAQHPEAP